MENNNSEKWQDHPKSSLGAVIMILSYPCNSVQEKIDLILESCKKHGTNKDEALRIHFRKYYEKPELYNHYGLFIE